MRQFALSGLFAACLAMPVFAEDVTITTAQGEVTLPSNPQRIAVYDVAAIDSLSALGVTPVAVPDQIFVTYLDDAVADAAKVGTLFEPDLEALANANPDLIIVGGRSATQLEALSKIAPTIDMTVGVNLVEDAKSRIEAYGILNGKEDEAGKLLETLDEKLAGVQDAAKGKGRALTVLTNGPKISAFGSGSRFGWIYDVTGLEQAVADLAVDSHGNAISHEFIAEANPDWMIVMDRGAAIGDDGPAAKATLSNPLVESTTAWKNDQVIYLTPTTLYIASGGYNGLISLLDELGEALNK